jgi:hypothetical protein
MNRIQNHGIASVYDRHHYAEQIKHIIEAVAARSWHWSRGAAADNVVQLARPLRDLRAPGARSTVDCTSRLATPMRFPGGGR